MPPLRMHARQPYKPLTDFQEGEIDALRPYFSHHEIGHQLAIPRRTVSNFLQRADERGSFEKLHPPGRPRKTSVSDDRYIVRTAELETRVPLAELRRDVGLNVSEQTLHRRLKESGKTCIIDKQAHGKSSQVGKRPSTLDCGGLV